MKNLKRNLDRSYFQDLEVLFSELDNSLLKLDGSHQDILIIKGIQKYLSILKKLGPLFYDPSFYNDLNLLSHLLFKLRSGIESFSYRYLDHVIMRYEEIRRKSLYIKEFEDIKTNREYEEYFFDRQTREQIQSYRNQVVDEEKIL